MRWTRLEKDVLSLYRSYKALELIPRPFFQRNVVWAEHGKSNFIESILLDFPIAAIYVYEDGAKWGVIDGQQRLTTIFDFIDNKYKLKDMSRLNQLDGCSFQDIVDRFPEYARILQSYQISITLIQEFDRAVIIDMYSRINRYTVNLSDQELRKAAYHDSDFLEIADMLATHEFFESNKFFTPRKRQRMIDVEYVSELLCILFSGIQDKKNTLDLFYDEYSNIENKSYYIDRFKNTLTLIETLFEHSDSPELKDFHQTRFNQQSDFYSLFAVIAQLDDTKKEKLIENKHAFRNFLLFYTEFITPESPIQIFRQYAIKCVSQANTKNSREFRYQFLNNTLSYILSKNFNELTKTIIDEINNTFAQQYSECELENILDFINKVDSDIDKYYAGQ